MTSKTLVAKIAAASLKVGALATDKTNVQQNYNYISADKILTRGGDALAAEGVVIYPSIISETTENVVTGNNKSRYDCTVCLAMIVTDGETQTELPWCGKGSDYLAPDKAFYKAITSGHKYFIAKLLNIGVGNEDGEHEEPQAAQDAKAARRPAVSATEDVDYSRQPDNPFDDAPQEDTRPLASQKQLNEMHAVAMEWYRTKENWEKKRPEWVHAAGGGAVSSSKDLSPEQVEWIIEQLQGRIANRKAKEAQQVTAA